MKVGEGKSLSSSSFSFFLPPSSSFLPSFPFLRKEIATIPLLRFFSSLTNLRFSTSSSKLPFVLHPDPPPPSVRVIAAAAAFQPPVRSELSLLRHQGLFFHLPPLWGSWGRRWREKGSMHSHNKQLGPSADIPIDLNTPQLIRH